LAGHSTGSSQLNTRTLNSDGNFDRVLQQAGINGSGVVVKILDSFLDTNSRFFYDPDVPLQNATLTWNHRKVVYTFDDPRVTSSYAEHGTHTSGTAVGKALCENCTAAKFTGIAPGARLTFRAWNFTDDHEALTFDVVIDLMNMTNSTVSSNSYGVTGFRPEGDGETDDILFENQDKAVFFAA
jgi:subtilisin family serine protease